MLDRRQMNAAISNFRVRIIIAATLISCALVLAAFALTDQELQQKLDNCHADRMDCSEGCQKNFQKGLIDSDGLQSCDNQCETDERKCKKAIEVAPKGTPPPKIGGLPTPTPRPGPSATKPPNKTNPTPTPRKGPGKTGTSGIGHSSPTPSPKGPVLLEKSGKPSPTPKPSHHHHG